VTPKIVELPPLFTNVVEQAFSEVRTGLLKVATCLWWSGSSRGESEAYAVRPEPSSRVSK
jgi:hypothetical protein